MNKRDILKLAAIVAMIAVMVMVFGRVGSVEGREENETVREAIKNAALTCYAVEGAYPDSIEYLHEHYQLAYNEDQYFVTYESFASNRLPDIWVTERGRQ